jgi:hypothetical protein
MLADHPFAKGGILLPHVPTILENIRDRKRRYDKTHDELLVSKRDWETAVECDAEVF